MDLMYIRDSNGIMDSGYLKHFEADFDITTDLDYVTNDFEIKMSLPSSDEELSSARQAIGLLGGELFRTADYAIPGTEVRHRLIIIRKCRETPKKYPRIFAKIKKNPL